VCDLCKGTGQVAATEKQTKTIYAFRCLACKAAESKGIASRIPHWQSRLAKYYDVDSTHITAQPYSDPRQKTADQGKTDDDFGDVPF